MPRRRREGPWLDRESNGVYHAYWYDAERRQTRRCSLGTRKSDEAKTRFGQFLIEGDAIREPHVSAPSVSAILDFYKVRHVDRKVVDQARTLYILDHLKKHFGDTPISDVDELACDEYMDVRQAGTVGKPAVPATVRRELSTLTAAANLAVRKKILDESMRPEVELPPGTEIDKDKWLDRETLAKLIDATRHERCRLFMQTGYWTAGRRNAVLRITRRRIDIKSRYIDLHPDGAPRTKKRNAVVPITDPLYDAIKTRVAAMRPDDYLLFHTGSIRTAFETACRRIGRTDVTPHWLRHSRATHLLQDGASIYDVAKLLGDSVATVEKTYGHHSAEHLGGGIARFDVAL